MKEQRKKTPADYPQFIFRMHTLKEKEDLNKDIESVLKIYRARQSESEKLHNKNDIIIEALQRGLTLMKSHKAQKKK